MDAAPMSILEQSSARATQRQRATLLAGLAVLAGVLCWSQWRALASVEDTYASALVQLAPMRVDARRIDALRRAPQTATGRTRPNEELLAQVERSLAAAEIDRSCWHDSIPQAPLRLPGSSYRKLTTRLYLADVSLKQLAAFAQHLRTEDPTLAVSAVDLANRSPDATGYDVDLAVSYLAYSPTDARTGAVPPR